ncbi:MAG: transporter, partial [candidate division Zixibacteria bacterium]
LNNLMKTHKKPSGLMLVLITLFAANTIMAGFVSAAGISIDAGLTPAENRWIFRSQMRFMQRDSDPTPAQREMKSYMLPVVVAYGIRSDLTIMIRQALRRNEIKMQGQSSSSTGLIDLLVLAKYRLLRLNTPSYTLGISPTLGIEIPSGADKFSSDSWDLHLGTFVSGRSRSWGIDLNVTYVWNGMAKTGSADRDPGDEFSMESALAHQFGLGPKADFALAPVIEFSYVSISSDSKDGITITNTGESVLLLSPGIKVTLSSIILESLLQFPLWQNQLGQQTERAPSFLVGIRIMN